MNAPRLGRGLDVGKLSNRELVDEWDRCARLLFNGEIVHSKDDVAAFERIGDEVLRRLERRP